ncbi:MAG: hypothetical protein A2946_02105 [Candidatus Liptonbacteria bacterium RIFCSPLOWO2_01_FULL_53_13]|uniref:Nucleotidyl transferase domain-containing protein n=1 Tax=Candidatus Liptonbacteria bacterium RIFCSPLOWO2_01_FULL_53_13 TaxID=1798651 RepID=A0A1G2CKA0_9BACT|nr:MAG: hypothetical protein A2946_02105 [Candidatus Liptonbacteria bacterium RIFCSPLOWO2_01_FULL_53_13]
MNVIFPLAGKDPRYPNLPKALVDVRGKPLAAYVLGQLRIQPEDKLIFVVLKEDVEKYHIDQILKDIAGENAIIRVLPGITQGSPCSIVEAVRDLIDNDTDVLVELGDVIRSVDNLYKDITAHRSEVSGIIPVEQRDMTGRPFGYVKTDEKGFAEALLEKELAYAAPWATMGLYYFSKGSDFVWAVNEMVRKRSFVYKEMFFVGPVYNELIGRGDKVMISENKIETMLGTPGEVESFREMRFL